MSRKALITGATGQDGAYLSKLLLEKGYEVFAAYRRSSDLNDWRLRALGIESDINLVSLELLEFSNVLRVIEKVQPDEVYNLAAQSFVQTSFDQPVYTSDVNALGPIRILEALRVAKADARFYQASTSEMFGLVQATPQNEETPFYPRSPYGVSKLTAHWITVNYRESYGLHASSGILFNHESPLRGLEFVTRKITSGLAAVSLGMRDRIELGNLDAQRDWGHAADYVRGMWMMLQQPEGNEIVLGTGETRSVRDFLEIAATRIGMDIEWSGSGVDEVGTDTRSGNVVVSINPEFYRPAEVDLLLADPSKAKEVLGWEPEISFTELVEQMVESDLARLRDSA